MRRQSNAPRRPNLLTRAVEGVFDLVRLAEFEILFVVFLVIVLLLIKDLTARPQYNQIFTRSIPDQLRQ
ncbi:hypothetical protein KFL_005070050 [Klebsormidium nitens]|uniref:Uncharacterized protein n=1 Tax=Klebsormidium nitens TaxID=105231 RepID=A0A1Y1IME8_KLENI|nr:hypothetical protein KFL_005070050 [Klebsormidium nitens]|eukprot:GAQ89288.1 hypothetical protein KFL_005070050 [Klebsormidium nitens]